MAIPIDPQDLPPLSRGYLEAMKLLHLDEDERCGMLRHMRQFSESTQHDRLGAGWDGAPRDPGVGYLQERLRPQGYVPMQAYQVPVSARCPDTPVPLGAQIVSRFTEMLTSEGRRPQVQVLGQEEHDQVYLAAALEAGGVWDTLTQARDMTGGCGAAAILLSLKDGWIQSEVLDPAHLWVAEWDASAPGWRPRIVVEQILRDVYVQDPESGRIKKDQEWACRAWTDTETIVYEPMPVKVAKGSDEKERVFKVAAKGRMPHKLGRCPVVWYQNTRATASPDGRSDLHGVWRQLDQLDRLQSQTYRATFRNVDPTPVYKDEQANRRRMGLMQLGSRSAIQVGPNGDVKYLELQGTSIKVGLEALDRLIDQVLQTTECVILTPETARAYTSGEALQIAWRSMEARAGRLRTTCGGALLEVCQILLTMGRAYGVGKGKIRLPPRMEKVEPEKPKDEDEPPEAHEEGKPHEMEEQPYSIRTKEEDDAAITVAWPPYWQPTAAQIQAMVAGMSAAVGAGKAVLSSETAVKSLATFLGKDAADEWARVRAEQMKAQAKMDQQMNLELGLDDEGNPRPEVPEPSDEAPADEDEEQPKPVAKKAAAAEG